VPQFPLTLADHVRPDPEQRNEAKNRKCASLRPVRSPRLKAALHQKGSLESFKRALAGI
jgi:hypothetical protein